MKHFFVPAMLSILLFSCKKKDKEDLPPVVYIGEGSSINNIALSKTIPFDSATGCKYDFYIRTEKGTKDITNLKIVGAFGGGGEAREFLIDDFSGDTTELNYEREIPLSNRNNYHIYLEGTRPGLYKRLVRAYTGGTPGDAVITLQFQN